MDAFTLPDLVTTQDLEELLGVKRAMISRLRKEDTRFPEPIAQSTPKRPLYRREDVLGWLVATGRAPEAALPVFAPAPGGGPITQRWSRVGAEFVKLPTGDGGYAEAHVTRYSTGEFSDPRVLSLVVPVGDPGISRLPGQHLSPAVIAALGYGGERGMRGAIAWIRPNNWRSYDHGDLFGAEVPDHPDVFEFGLRLKLLDAEVISQIIGHLLPYWEQGAISKTAAALWEPRPLNQHTPPVPASHTPPGLAVAAGLRRWCREVIDQITTGARPAPPEIVDELAQLGNTMWDTTLSHQFNWDKKTSIEVPPGWVLPIEPPQSTLTDPNPPLPKQPGEVDLFHALQWLIEQPDLPHDMARTATDYYGYPNSIDVLTLDCGEIPEHLRTAIERHLTPIPAHDNWLHEALTTALEHHQRQHLSNPGNRPQDPAAADGAGASLGWVTDTDPQSHPARSLPGHRAGDLLAYHVPRTLLEIGTPAVVHLFATTVGDRRRYGGILIDRTGAVSPIPLDPDPAAPRATAAQLAALALGITEPLHLGRQPKLREEPPQLTQLTAALATTDHLEIDWETLCGIVGPRPDGLDDRDLVTTLNDREHWNTPDLRD
ncbi:hypothetical protein [Nocardia sp. CA-120079]|uniref:hypothetical protein n=1 Tax=Nocardia sp. CA-120079 TaxID=3239974 RepID=UPI003D990611